MRDSELVGKTVRIIHMKGEHEYCGRRGKVLSVDDAGQLHGTWGSLAIIPELDAFVVEEEKDGKEI